jgi:general L-amino acid transport system permease protein
MAARPAIAEFARRNLFRSTLDAVVTVVATLVIGFVAYRLGRFVFVTGRWDVVRDNLTLFMVGRYPTDELWRIAVALCAGAIWGGLLSGALASDLPDPRRIVVRIWPVLLGVLLLLALSTTPTPWVVAFAVGASFMVGRIAGRWLPRRATALLAVVALVGVPLLVWMLTAPVGWDEWGGIMLNLFLAAAGISLSFPLGVLLALGRRSKLPLLRAVSVVYIEIFRGVPLYVLLLLSALALGFFLPSYVEPPGLVTRAIVALTLFTAAYVAEIVRGGLQALPKGQTEAALALGMSPATVTFRIVLPQALRAVVPALVGQFISLFIDTTLAGAAMGFFEVLNATSAAQAQAEFRGQQLTAETVSFVMLLFWIGCITMSRESQRLERRLGVGVR